MKFNIRTLNLREAEAVYSALDEHGIALATGGDDQDIDVSKKLFELRDDLGRQLREAGHPQTGVRA